MGREATVRGVKTYRPLILAAQRRDDRAAKLAAKFISAVRELWGLGDGHGGLVAELLGAAAAAAGLEAADWTPLRRADVLRLAARDGWVCHYCGLPLGWGHASVTAPEVDHKRPRALGGTEGLDNKVLACGPCNTAKGEQDHGAFCAVRGKGNTSVVDSVLGSSIKSKGSTKSISTSKVKTIPSDGSRAWSSYEAAYARRYGVAPVRNRVVNSVLKAFTARVPLDEAEGIAAFYVRHNAAFYVRAGHPVNLLLRDAEKLRTEWITGRRMTETGARNADQTQELGDMVDRLSDREEPAEVRRG